MAASDIRAGAAFVELYVKGTFQKDLNAVQRQLKSFGDSLMNMGKQMLAIGAAISAPLILAAREFATLGDAVNKASQRTGIAVEELTALKYAVEQSGASFEDLETGIRKMEKAIFDAADGSENAHKALASLNLTAHELQRLTPDQQFSIIAQRLSQVTDAGTKAALAIEIFGRNGTTLLPLISNGAKGIQQLTERARELGVVFGQDDADAATKFAITINDLYKQFKALLFTVGAGVANTLQPFATGLRNILANIIAWANANRALVVGVVLSAIAFLAVGSALVGLAVAIKTAATVTSALSATISLITGLFTFLINPVVLVGLGVAALATYFSYASGVMGQAIDWLGNKFSQLADISRTTFQGIADALSAGGIQLAAQILWTGLQLAWAQGTQELSAAWVKFKYEFVQVAAAAFYGALEIYENVEASLTKAWLNTVATFGDIWDGFTSYFGDVWDKVINNVTKGILYVQSLFDGSDYDAAAKASDAQLEKDSQDRFKASQASVAQRADDLQKQLDQVEKEKQAAIARYDNDEQELSKGADDASRDEINELEQRRAALQKQLADLRKQAGDEKRKADNSKPPIVKPFGFDTDDILANRQAISSPAKATGIFNVAALQSLQGGRSEAAELLKNIVKSSGETARNTRNKATFK